METEESPLYNALGCLKFFLSVPFIVGIIWNWDGFQILSNNKDYKDGILKVTSYNYDRGVEGGDPTLFGVGMVDSIQTAITISEDMDSISIPIWYKADGKLSVRKYPNESEFPFWRIFWKWIFYIGLFNGPFIGLGIWQLILKRKLKLKKNEK
jgi:hypothetical protein